MPIATDQLPALLGKIATVLATEAGYFVTHPAEVRLLQNISIVDLRELARRRGWRVVSKVGGRQVQFYNDVTFRRDASSRNQPAG